MSMHMYVAHKGGMKLFQTPLGGGSYVRGSCFRAAAMYFITKIALDPLAELYSTSSFSLSASAGSLKALGMKGKSSVANRGLKVKQPEPGKWLIFWCGFIPFIISGGRDWKGYS